MGENHDCEQLKCEETVRKTLFICCNKCKKKCYCECLYNSDDTIFDLLYAFQILVKTDKEKNYKWNANENLLKRFQTQFGDDKPFSFKCQQCKNEPTNDENRNELLSLQSKCDMLASDLVVLQSQIEL